MQKKHLYFIAAIHLCNDISSGAMPAVLPFFVLNYGMDYTSMAGLMFAGSFLSSVIQPLFGYFADKTSKLWFMALGVFLTGVSLAVTGFVQDYWCIFAAITMMGIGSSIFHPEAASMVNHIAGRQKGSAMSIFSVGGNGGFGLGPLLAVFLITTFGMEGLAFFGIIGVVMGAAAFFLVPMIKESADRKMALAAAQADGADEAAGEADNGQKTSDKYGSSGTNDWGAFGKLTALITFRAMVFTSLSSFLPLYCIQILGASQPVGTATLSILSLSGILTTLIGGYFADRWGYIAVLRWGTSLLVPLLAICFFGGSIYWVYAMLLPMSLALYSTYSPFVVLGQTYLAKNIGFASGVTLGLSFSVGGVTAPFLGRYADIFGLESVMVLIVVAAVLCAAASFMLPQPKKA
ncbi:MAG: MFS transporter [Anaerovibrio sp.]